MLPFCGYNMGDYFEHWLKVGASAPDASKLPRFFFVNWFRKDENGKFVWPGFGDNARVLKWIVERLEGTAAANDTPVGRIPSAEALDLSGLDLTAEQMELLLNVDVDVWTEEAGLIPAFYEKFADRLPKALWEQHAALTQRLEEARAARLAAE